MPLLRSIPWWQADWVVDDLGTDNEHEIRIQREAIPLVFVPGIMGTRLRRAGTQGKEKKKGPDGLPNMRWDPSSASWMARKYAKRSPEKRKAMLVGTSFKPGYLEVANDDPVKDGFSGIMAAYWKKFLKPVLKERDWGPISKIFEFPVYAVGYNWTDDSRSSGEKLVARIREIIDEAREITGICEKVILITHSMGGLVARWAIYRGAESSVLGVIHGVQPVTGSPAAYWRVKAGFEASRFRDRPATWILGDNGPRVTAVLGNIPGGLQLLPNGQYRTNERVRSWLSITEDGEVQRSFPDSNPYRELYKVKAEVRPKPGQKPSTNEYWGLIDPLLLDPGDLASAPSRPLDEHEVNSAIDAAEPVGGQDAWGQYLKQLAKAEAFHDELKARMHPRTYCIRGVGHSTPDQIELRVKPGSAKANPYGTRKFRGIFTDADGRSLHAVLQDPAGVGDGTVPESSAAFLDAPGVSLKTQHQPAFENKEVQSHTVQAILTFCGAQYEERRGSEETATAAGAGGAGRAGGSGAPAGTGGPPGGATDREPEESDEFGGFGGGGFGGGGAGGDF